MLEELERSRTTPLDDAAVFLATDLFGKSVSSKDQLTICVLELCLARNLLGNLNLKGLFSQTTMLIA